MVIALVLLALASILFRRSPATNKSSGPSWYSKLSPFGAAPREDPAPASAVPARELAPPERMMTNAMTRQFSNPSGGSSGGLAGAEPAEQAASAASMSPSHLSAGDVNLPGGGRAQTAGGGGSAIAPPSGGAGARERGSSSGGGATASPSGGAAAVCEAATSRPRQTARALGRVGRAGASLLRRG